MCKFFRKKYSYISVVLAILLYNSLLKTNYFYYQFWAKGILSCHIWNQNPWICLIPKYCEIMHFWHQTIFDFLIPKYGIFGLEFWKTIVTFEIITLKFVYLQNFTKKQKCLNLGPKVPDLGILGLEFENNIVIFEIKTLEFI